MEELHRFIQHLDSNEKKYFRRFGLKDESKGNSQTSALFELLDSFEIYEEEKIENRIKRLKLDKQINHTKNYLFGLLTETITWYHRERFTGFNSAYELAKIQLLEEKGLYHEAERKSIKIIKQAFEQGTFADRWDAFGYSIQVALNNFCRTKKMNQQKPMSCLVNEKDC